ncbi:MAG: hypothetical protein ABEH35_01230 [Haloarculaceae archaeon]
MDIRDAVEADAERLADLSDAPTDVMRNLVHDRTVRVALAGDGDGDEIAGFVSFDAREGVVHITQLDGSPAACERLLQEPISFADRENMSVELLVPDDETTVRSAAEDAGFKDVGTGPMFDGQPTTRYRLKPAERTT